MSSMAWTFVLLLSNVILMDVDCATYAEVTTEYSRLVAAYSIAGSTNGDPYSQTIPTDSLPMEVTLTLNIFSLSRFDPVAGTIDIVGSLNMEWIDEIANASSPTLTFNSGTVNSFLVDYTLIWTPVIVLVNSADSVEKVGDASYKARYHTATGKVTWQPRMILKASCTPDVSYFPFDDHTCTLTFQSWTHDSSLVHLLTGSSNWGMEDFELNGVWTVVNTKSAVVLKAGYYVAEFEIKIQRKALYFTINIIFPILLLSALSGCLFLLPAASGERVGFGITCFLSFVVLLQITMSFLPEASAPMSILCYYVIMMMSLSAVLSIVNILLVKVHMTDVETPLPRWLVHFVEFVNCTKFKRWRRNRSKRLSDVEVESTSVYTENPSLRKDAQKNSYLRSETSNVSIQLNGLKHLPDSKRDQIDQNEQSLSRQTSSFCDANERSCNEIKDKDDETVDWISVGNFLDFFFLLVFIISQVFLSLVFLVPLASRAA